MSIDFKKITSSTKFMNPFKDLALDEIPFEIRFDPLTGKTGHVFDVKYKAERPDLPAIVQLSKEIFCPFCPETLEKSTPLFPAELIPEGRIRVGRASLIPNLLPFDQYAGVVIMSDQHYIAIEDLNPESMLDAFSAALVFVKRVFDWDPKVNSCSVNWNYMPPSGSSMVHPHLQISCGEVHTNEMRMQLDGSREYYNKTGTDFWQDLMEAERGSNERYLGKIGSTFWSLNYVPYGFLPDVSCIFEDHWSLCDLEENDLTPFLKGLSNVFTYFGQEDIISFNMSIFSVREDEHFRINARICPRLYPRPIGNSDHSYLQTIHNEPFTVRPPEAVCRKLKVFFD